MTTPPTSTASSQQAAVDAALLILERIGLSPEDLTASPGQRPAVPTFADYVPVVSATVTDGTRKAYGSYWNRVVEQWGTRRLDEPTPSQIKQLVTETWAFRHCLTTMQSVRHANSKSDPANRTRTLYRPRTQPCLRLGDNTYWKSRLRWQCLGFVGTGHFTWVPWTDPGGAGTSSQTPHVGQEKLAPVGADASSRNHLDPG